MYALVENNEITKIITNPKTMVIGDVRYPAKIFQLWSASELNAIGIYEVITDSTNKKDEAYYINTNMSVLPSVLVAVGAVDAANSNTVFQAIVCEPL